jgi:formate C-acetyltransferase
VTSSDEVLRLFSMRSVEGASNGIHTGYLYDMESLDELKAAIRKHLEYFFYWGVSLQNYVEYQAMWYAPQAALSISIEGCMEKGKDVVCGGAKYNSFGHTATGLATIADSLTAIKYMCFDKGLCTTRELYDALMANWEGYEHLRQTIINECPHYGNGDPYADVEMKWICDLYYELCQGAYSTRARIYKAGQYGAGGHVIMGMDVAATPDGRLAGTPIADGASPVQGRDRNGPTAI